MSAALVLDLALVALIIGRAFAGWRVGALVSLLGLVGVVAGALAGWWLAPQLLARAQLAAAGYAQTLAMMAILLVGALVGEWVGARVGAGLRRHNSSRVGRFFDALLGSVSAVLVVAFVLWFVGAALRPMLPVAWARTLNSSTMLAKLDSWVPQSMSAWPSQVTDALRGSQWPQVFGGLTPEPELPIPAPDGNSAQSPAVQAAAGSVVEVQSHAPACQASMSGSGWVVAPQRVVTNAHVVAGGERVFVQLGGRGRAYESTVVAFDPDLDLAILAVPGLAVDALPRAGAQPDGTEVAALGFPGGGEFTVSPARIRGSIIAAGEDIYGGAGVLREVYSIRGVVRPGNSGGPLLTNDGAVAGTVFATSTLDAETGYVLTDRATEALLDDAAGFSAEVSSGECVLR